jgi:hypothetical protein
MSNGKSGYSSLAPQMIHFTWGPQRFVKRMVQSLSHSASGTRMNIRD